ncbi:hypothetical protein M0657_008927 [Pyricularia oryzae]|uniref:Uncharacterized protein n=2 Tax=Pyricularia TaxID=48558 RepID=A0ABQ8NRV0_PYRGI|nr:hypothetical protein MCOR01_008536 [Pyricularia oryzae]KAI6301234.1 hypothetical protein MCOR33_003182 [Pyricularia grisea]KAI6254072.1 hypothetical protein MCOR19_009419 [Pyricularia oryzae]KAI6325469.1 hypothetical protein MCOR34_001102 [Pyricularia oryzae]KAI6330953.1 hypothetical protein MCOR28_011514 [Pyricularia oryzae]
MTDGKGKKSSGKLQLQLLPNALIDSLFIRSGWLNKLRLCQVGESSEILSPPLFSFLCLSRLLFHSTRALNYCTKTSQRPEMISTLQRQATAKLHEDHHGELENVVPQAKPP